MEEAVGIEKGHVGYASYNFNEIGVGLGKNGPRYLPYLDLLFGCEP
jgi:hypothetical protein